MAFRIPNAHQKGIGRLHHGWAHGSRARSASGAGQDSLGQLHRLDCLVQVRRRKRDWRVVSDAVQEEPRLLLRAISRRTAQRMPFPVTDNDPVRHPLQVRGDAPPVNLVALQTRVGGTLSLRPSHLYAQAPDYPQSSLSMAA